MPRYDEGGASPGLLISEHLRPALSGASGCAGEYPEHTRWDPKDSELCLARMKPGETLVEVRSDSDVQIDRLS